MRDYMFNRTGIFISNSLYLSKRSCIIYLMNEHGRDVAFGLPGG